jgi:hypothetical protein
MLASSRPCSAQAEVATPKRMESGRRATLPSTAAMAMTAPDDEAPAFFDLALASDGAERCPFERARVHQLFGERLRRARAATTARVHLGAVLDEFRRLGAPTWADRAAMALRATGESRQQGEKCAHGC